MCATLTKEGVSKQYPIHRLVAMAFLNKNDFKYHPKENPSNIDLNKLIVNHKDENKHNNCVDNLEWCTQQYNMSYSAYKHKGKPIIQYDKNYKYIRSWKNIYEACETLGLCKKYIYDCCTNRRKTYANSIWEYDDTKKEVL